MGGLVSGRPRGPRSQLGHQSVVRGSSPVAVTAMWRIRFPEAPGGSVDGPFEGPSGVGVPAEPGPVRVFGQPPFDGVPVLPDVGRGNEGQLLPVGEGAGAALGQYFAPRRPNDHPLWTVCH